MYVCMYDLSYFFAAFCLKFLFTTVWFGYKYDCVRTSTLRGKRGDFDEEKVLLNINIKICRSVNVSRRKILQ